MAEKEWTEVSEQLRLIADMAESKIFKGEMVFLGKPERVWIKGLLERKGFLLSKIEGRAMLSEQAKAVVEIIGKEKSISMTAEIVIAMLESGGNVFGKGDFGGSQKVREFVTEYLTEQLTADEINFEPQKYKGNGQPGSNWRMNTIYRIEAVMSVTNKLMWILAAETEEEGERRQTTNGVSKHVRERVLRGLERGGEALDESLPRIDKDKIIRFLPKGGLGKILDRLVAA